MRVGVIGAGLSGLVAARTVAQAGHDVVVIEKSRGVGGRLAARRVDGTVVDHGAPVIDVPDHSGLGRLIADLAIDDQVVLPEGVAFRAGATRLAKALAAELDVVLGVRITAIRTMRDGRFELAGEQGNNHGIVDAVIISAPAPQAADLLDSTSDEAGRAARLRTIVYDAAIMIVAGLVIPTPTTLDPFSPSEAFTRITAESVKGRDPVDGVVPVVARIGPTQSAADLDASDEDIVAAVVPELMTACGAVTPPAWVQVKRWRFATCSHPFDFGGLNPSNTRIVVCGDSVAGTDLGGVYESGLLAARRVLS